MTALERVNTVASHLGMTVIGTGSRPVTYHIYNVEYHEIFQGSYQNALAFLTGADYQRKFMDGLITEGRLY